MKKKVVKKAHESGSRTDKAAKTAAAAAVLLKAMRRKR